MRKFKVGELVWLEKAVSSLPNNIRSIFADWPERDQIESSLFELSPRGVVLTRPNGTILACNAAMAGILGYTPDELIGLHFNQFTHPEDATVGVEGIRAVLEGRTEYMLIEKRYLHKNGTAVWARVHGTASRDKDGRVILFTSAIDDLTQERQRDMERRAAAEQQAQMQAQIIATQRETLRQLSTPIIPIRDGVVAIPLIGGIDSERAHQLLETVLWGVAQHRSQLLIVDISGVPNIDDDVAGLLLRMTRAVRLLGAEVILSGIRAEVAQRFVSLGIDLGGLKTIGSFQSAIALALGNR